VGFGADPNDPESCGCFGFSIGRGFNSSSRERQKRLGRGPIGFTEARVSDGVYSTCCGPNFAYAFDYYEVHPTQGAVGFIRKVLGKPEPFATAQDRIKYERAVQWITRGGV
jgi:hypothetical protein